MCLSEAKGMDINMEKVIIYGTGKYYDAHKDKLPDDIKIVAYMDSHEKYATSISGQLYEGGVPILLPSEWEKIEFDKIYICTDYANGILILLTLMQCIVPLDKIAFLNEKLAALTWRWEITDDKRGVIVTVGSVRFKLQYITDFFIFREIFLENIYNVELPFADYIVIDIGMNIGIASLFFAEQTKTIKVYGFEPFEDTYRQALDNFARNNPEIQNKIIPCNIALYDEDKKMECAVLHEDSGLRNVFCQDDTSRKVEITYRTAGKVIGDILKRECGKKVVLKCDIEGSEYAVFNSLEEYGCLEKIDAVLLEYHKSAYPLQEIFMRHGYKFFTVGASDIAGFGMIYAVK